MQARYGEEEEELVEIYWRERDAFARWREKERKKENSGRSVCQEKKTFKKFSSKSVSFDARTVFKIGE